MGRGGGGGGEGTTSVKPCRHELKGSACTLLLQGTDLRLFAVDENFELVRKTETEEDKRSESTETEQSMMYAIKNREVNPLRTQHT